MGGMSVGLAEYSDNIIKAPIPHWATKIAVKHCSGKQRGWLDFARRPPETTERRKTVSGRLCR